MPVTVITFLIVLKAQIQNKQIYGVLKINFSVDFNYYTREINMIILASKITVEMSIKFNEMENIEMLGLLENFTYLT